MIASLLTSCIVRSSVYPAPDIEVPPQPPAGLEEISLDLSGGESVVCWWYKSDSLSAQTPFMLYLHGNGENLQSMYLSGLYDRLAGLGVEFLALDYPGYGRSTGEPSETSISEACDRAILWMSHTYPGRKIVVCGWSLGAGAAISAAAANKGAVHAVVAMSAWTSLTDVASRFYPRFLFRLLVRDRYNSLETLGWVHVPILLIHGRLDKLIPLEQAQRLLTASRYVQRLVPLEQTAHNDLPGNPIAWAEVRAFLRSQNLTPPPALRPEGGQNR